MSADAAKKNRPFRIGYSIPTNWLLLMLIMVVFIILMYPKLVIQSPNYIIGDIAEHNVKATRDFFIEDPEATEASRQQAVAQVLAVYDLDPRISQNIASRVRNAFSDMRDLAADLDIPHAPVTDDSFSDPASAEALEAKLDEEREQALWAHKDQFQSLLGIDINQGAYRLMINEDFSANIANLINQVLTEIFANGVVGNKEVLLKEGERGITLRDIVKQTEKTVYGLRQYYGPDQAKTMVRIVAEPLVRDLNYNIINMIVDVAQRLLQPNITFNRNETEARKKKALAEIKPVMYQIKAGEMLLREGERITSIQLLKFKAQENRNDLPQLTAAGLGVGILVAVLLTIVHMLVFHQPRLAPLNTNLNMLFLSLILTAVFLLTKFGASLSGNTLALPPSAILFAIPAGTGAMLVCLILEFNIALPFSLVSGVCAALLVGQGFEFFLFFFIHNAMAAYWVKDCRERKHFISAGAKVGLINVLMSLAIFIYSAESNLTHLLWNAMLGFAGGMACGIITVGVAPLMEMAFGYTTDITLLELANLDRPILRRLMLEAPGTYHHSVIVGSLVEAAAAEIGANPLLAKVSGYYHDIGKVKKPLYFIENQKGGLNRHDKLAPSMSSLILIAHIKDGVEIARRNKLGQKIIDVIQQHHGTSLISFFYEKAKQLKGEDRVKIEDFRYPGPRPQTKEAGLVMLADVVEAASRTLENPTPARIQGVVQNLINKIFSDGQLDNCELTLKDLHRIAKSFNTILYGIHHHRIEYNEPITKENGREKHGGSDRQPAKKSSGRDQTRSREGESHLKRLGLS